MNNEKLKPCPFCGAPAGVKSEHDNFQIIGCMTRENEVMLCPSPTTVVYKKKTVVVLITLTGTDGQHNLVINGASTKINNAGLFI